MAVLLHDIPEYLPRGKRIARGLLIGFFFLVPLVLLRSYLNYRFANTGYQVLLAAPAIAAAWYGGRRTGYLIAYLGLALALASDYLLSGGIGRPFLATGSTIVAYLIFALQQFLAIALIERLRRENSRAFGAVRELAEEQALTSSLIDSDLIGIVFFRPDGTRFRMNRAGRIILGIPLDEPVSSWDGLVPDEYLEKTRDATLAAMRGSVTPCEIELNRRDGTRVPILMGGGHVEGRPDELISFFLDVTERNRAERDLRIRTTALDSASNGIVIADPGQPDAPIIFANPAFLEMTGYALEEVIGRNCRFLQGPGTDQGSVAHLRAGVRETLLNYRKDGTPFWNELAVSPVLAADGTVTHFIGVQNDVTDRRRSEERFAHQATHDSLTGLPNRIALQERLAQSCALAHRADRGIAVLFLDLDRFKLINDTLGHQVGDQLLVAVATRLQTAVREGDTVARFGGDEFVVVLNEIENREDVLRVVNGILRSFQTSVVVGEKSFRVNTSIGIALYPEDGESGETLIKHADVALYQAKEHGRNTYFFYDAAEYRPGRSLAMEADLYRAMADKELEMYYQPIMSSDGSKVLSAEALVRWVHPERGVIRSEEFITYAENAGMIYDLSDYVFTEVFSQLKRWEGSPYGSMPVAVNVSAPHFYRPDFLEEFTSAIRRTGADPNLITVEVTEGLAMRKVDASSAKLNELRSMGISVALDDFGVGQTSLSYIRQLPITTIKIDKSFIQKAAEEPVDLAIVQAVCALARNLGLRTVGEGVENEEMFRFIEGLGMIDQLQGWYFAKALPVDQFEAYVASVNAVQPPMKTKAFGTRRPGPRT